MKKFLNLQNILNIIFILSCLAFGITYLLVGGLAFKSVASASFFAVGLINLIFAILKKNHNLKFCIIMAIGLFFAMLGDIFLEIHFIAGAALFAVGHIFYFTAYCFISKFKWTDLIVGVIIIVPSVLFMTLAPIFNYGGIVMQLLCIVYAVVISLMVGKAITNFIKNRNVLNLLLMIGSVLFFFSDLMLLLNVFSNIETIVFSVLCLATYFPAECVLAYSLTQSKSKENE